MLKQMRGHGEYGWVHAIITCMWPLSGTNQIDGHEIKEQQLKGAKYILEQKKKDKNIKESVTLDT